jgi:hypothetical protein
MPSTSSSLSKDVGILSGLDERRENTRFTKPTKYVDSVKVSLTEILKALSPQPGSSPAC